MSIIVTRLLVASAIAAARNPRSTLIALGALCAAGLVRTVLGL